MLHLTNITGHHNTVRLALDGRPIGSGELRLPPRTSAFLALGLDTPVGRVEWANAELTAIEEDGLAFGPPLGDETTVVLRGAADVLADGATVRREGDLQTITAPTGVLVRTITP